MMARASRQQPATAAEAMETSRHRWAVYLADADAIPPSWPIDWRPDGTKPCKACGNRHWHQPSSGEGWLCWSCHPPDRSPANEVPPRQKEAA